MFISIPAGALAYMAYRGLSEAAKWIEKKVDEKKK